jgi:hypothetical protein
MTGFVNHGPMPLSAITVGSLADLGYTVNPLWPIRSWCRRRRSTTSFLESGAVEIRSSRAPRLQIWRV